MMAASVLHMLLNATLATSLAVLLIAALRVPLRVAVGARAAYWVWLLLPTMLTTLLLPVPSASVLRSAHSLAARMGSSFSVLIVAPHRPGVPIYVLAALTVWALGAAVMAIVQTRRQRAFIRSLGTLMSGTGGTLRSDETRAPMLLGAWRSRLLLPADFESRYPATERQLMLAHEEAHRQRRDVLVNTLASGWLCLSWFNPLMYWAVGRLRLDQELACDAVALARTQVSRQRYADALLQTQLASESGWNSPIACRWQPRHPLKERIIMLKRRPPGSIRRISGVVLVLGLTLCASYAAWAAQMASGSGAGLYLSITITTWTPHTPPSDPPGVDTFALSSTGVVHSGEGLALKMPDHPIDAGCMPFLPGTYEPTAESGPAVGGPPAPQEGQILIRCRIVYNGELISTPSLIALDGRPTSVRIDDAGRGFHYQLVVTASTSLEKFAAATSDEKDLTTKFLRP